MTLKAIELCVLSIMLLITGCNSGGNNTDENNTVIIDTNTDISTAEKLSKWVRSLNDSSSWSSLFSSNTFGYSDFHLSNEAYLSICSTGVYDLVLEKVSNSIVSVECISSSTDNYVLDVRYKPYEMISNFNLDETSIKGIFDEYTNTSGGIDDNVFEKLITEEILNQLDSCYILANEIKSIRYTFYTDTDGYINNGRGFLNEIMNNQNVLQILGVFEEEISKELPKVIDDYVN